MYNQWLKDLSLNFDVFKKVLEIIIIHLQKDVIRKHANV